MSGQTYCRINTRAYMNADSFLLLVERICQNKIAEDDSRALKVDSLPTIISKILDLQHRGIRKPGSLGKQPFEVGKEGRVV